MAVFARINILSALTTTIDWDAGKKKELSIINVTDVNRAKYTWSEHAWVIKDSEKGIYCCFEKGLRIWQCKIVSKKRNKT